MRKRKRLRRYRLNHSSVCLPAVDHNRRSGRTRARFGLRLVTGFLIRSLRSLETGAPEPLCSPGPDAGC